MFLSPKSEKRFSIWLQFCNYNEKETKIIKDADYFWMNQIFSFRFSASGCSERWYANCTQFLKTSAKFYRHLYLQRCHSIAMLVCVIHKRNGYDQGNLLFAFLLVRSFAMLHSYKIISSYLSISNRSKNYFWRFSLVCVQ